MIRKIFALAHRILGAILCLFFLMWFLSGFVMIYHGYPRVKQDRKLLAEPALTSALPADTALCGQLPDTAKLQSLSVEMRFGRPIAYMKGKGVPASRYLDNGQPEEPFSEEVRTKELRRWCSARIERIDTLTALDIWIPFGRNRQELPIYKYHFADKAQHQLYMTSRDGRILQFTDRESRFWAYIGAIPHWIYFTFLRQHQEAWTQFVIWSSGIGCVMCLIGLGLGIQSWWHTRRKGLLRSPYTKGWHKWHFVTGVFFGLFAITFAFSGLMSMRDIPDWMKKQKEETHRTGGMRGRQGAEAMLPLDRYALDYRRILADCDSVKRITWGSWGGHPFYQVQSDFTTWRIDAADTTGITPFRLAEEWIRQDATRQLGDSVKWTLTLMTDYDSDYYARKKDRVPLPVYRVVADDYMHTHIYYQPETLVMRRIDDDSRLRSLLYGGLHRLNLKWLTDRPVLWHIVMFTLLIGGSLLSLTGVAVSLKWIIRSLRRKIGMRKPNTP